MGRVKKETFGWLQKAYEDYIVSLHEIEFGKDMIPSAVCFHA